MERNIKDNPFAALSSNVYQALQFKQQESSDDKVATEHIENEKVASFENYASIVSGTDIASPAPSNETLEELENKCLLSDLLETIFLITTNPSPERTRNRPSHCVYLEEMSKESILDVQQLDQATFERLIIPEPEKHVIRLGVAKDESTELQACETKTLVYLFQCYLRWSACKKEKVSFNVVMEKSLQVIISNAQLALTHPEILLDQNLHQQVVDLLSEDTFLTACEFLDKVLEAIDSAQMQDEVSFEIIIYPILDIIREQIRNCTLVDPRTVHHFKIVHYFAKQPLTSSILVQHSTPLETILGRVYEQTLLGSMLSISCLPRSEFGAYEYFDQPSRYSQGEHELTERNLWMSMKLLSVEMHHLFLTLLRSSPDIRHALLNWIGSCLHANKGRAQLWNLQVGNMSSPHVPDGFMLNLSFVLLRLCKPFCEPCSPKLMNIDPTYCAAVVTDEQMAKTRGLHLKDLSKETCLIPCAEGEERQTSDLYNFSTECFFLTHHCLSLGFHVVYERFMKLNMDLRTLQRAYTDAVQQGGERTDIAQNMKETLERGMVKFLSMKAAMLEPDTIEMLFNFHLATITWLSNNATSCDNTVFHPVKFPLSPIVPDKLKCIPEFVVDNVAEFLIFLRRFSPHTYEIFGGNLHHIMTFIMVFMGSPERMRNPHLRAHLAEVLESLMPHEEEVTRTPYVTLVHREALFREHPLIKHLSTTLLHVFVTIEMTGQSVSFEQKFKYRRPMYVVIDYLWKIKVHRKTLKELAEDAEKNCELATPPLFLRFINLLMNDAIFLLDEALIYMSRLRDMQQKQNSEEWSSLTPQQRQENSGNYQHTGMLARFHNVMSNDTIHTLELLTQEIRSIFTIPSMLDRIAAMLNYFLLNLVGPKNKSFKVHNLKEYEFKPKELVADICKIYVHLGEERNFCLAVAGDGRSYSSSLFDLAEEVLFKIGQGVLVPSFQQVAEAIKRTAELQKSHDETLADAPEEFIDPIMGILMTDPMMLPSSRVIVDKSTILRHLLSDQFDPFNRSPLTMEMVIPATELKDRIQKWLQETSDKFKAA